MSLDSAPIWAALAFLGWAVLGTVLVLFARTQVSQANAFSILEKMDDRFDSRVNAVVERFRKMSAARNKPPQVPQPPPPGATPEIDAIFADSANARPIGEQPPSAEEGLEVFGA